MKKKDQKKSLAMAQKLAEDEKSKVPVAPVNKKGKGKMTDKLLAETKQQERQQRQSEEEYIRKQKKLEASALDRRYVTREKKKASLAAAEEEDAKWEERSTPADVEDIIKID